MTERWDVAPQRLCIQFRIPTAQNTGSAVCVCQVEHTVEPACVVALSRIAAFSVRGRIALQGQGPALALPNGSCRILERSRRHISESLLLWPACSAIPQSPEDLESRARGTTRGVSQGICRSARASTAADISYPRAGRGFTKTLTCVGESHATCSTATSTPPVVF